MSARFGLSTSVAAALLMSAGAAWAGPPAVEGSESGLGVTGPETPQMLQQVASAPYAPTDGASCTELAEQIAALNDVLGPDVDAQPVASKTRSVGHAAAGVVRSFIPYRGVMRLVTGAGRKEAQLGQAVIAGAARRGYLRGLAHERGCDLSQPVAAPAEVAAQPLAAVVEAPVLAIQPVAASAYLTSATEDDIAYERPAHGSN